MARQRTLPENAAADVLGTQAAETPAEPAGRSNEKSTNGEASNLRRETENSSLRAMGANNTAKHGSREGKMRREKGQQRGNDSERKRKSANGLTHQSSDVQDDDINGSVRSSPSSIKCIDSISDRNKHSSDQRSSMSVDGSFRTADLTVYVQAESSDESGTTDDAGSEIDLRAKTGKELYKQKDYCESEGNDSSEVDECAVQASFGLFDPREGDKEAIGCLLRQSLLQSDLKFSLSALRQLAATIAEQGNVGSILKTVDDEDSEEGGLQHVSQERSSDNSIIEGEKKGKNNSDAGHSSPAATSAGGQPTSESVYEDAREFEARQEEGESGTVVGFLTLLSFQQYPEVVAPFKKAILRLAGEHASVEQKTALERLFLAPALKSEKMNLHSKSSSSSSNEASSKPAAQRNEVDDRAVNCGWLLKERLSNTPPQLIPQMYDSLLDDISWSLSTEEMDEAERPFYAYSYVCGLTKVYKEGDGHSQSRASKRHKMGKALPFDAIFPHPEDELLLNFATQSFAWPTGRSGTGGSPSSSSGRQYRGRPIGSANS